MGENLNTNFFEKRHTFDYTKREFVIHNFRLPVYQYNHNRNVIFVHPQEDCSVNSNTKSKQDLLLAKSLRILKCNLGSVNPNLHFSC